MRLGAAAAPAGTIVWAREQTAGRGRRGRPWASPPGNLYCSVLLRPRPPRADWGQVSFVAAVALAEAVARAAPGVSPRLKWPNDVLVAGRKLAGILLEADGDALVAGIGVNVASHPDGATSLAREGATADVAALLTEVATALLDWLERWEAAGFAPVRAAWLERAVGLGGAVQVRLADETLSGTFAALDEQGALVLDGGRRISAGDVTLIPGA